MKHFLCTTLILCTLFLCTSCGSTVPPASETPVLTWDSTACETAVIVYPAKGGSRLADAVATLFLEQFGVEHLPDTIPDSAETAAPRILVGQTAHTPKSVYEALRADEFTVTAEGNDLILCGGSEEATLEAVAYFGQHLLTPMKEQGELLLMQAYTKRSDISYEIEESVLNDRNLNDYVLYAETKDGDSVQLLTALQEQIALRTGYALPIVKSINGSDQPILSLNLESDVAPNTAELHAESNGIHLCAADRDGGVAISEFFFTYLKESRSGNAAISVHTLPNIRYKLEVEKSLTVLFVGDSTAAGAGVSNKQTDTLAGHILANLQKDHPDAQIKMINVGVGGTSSAYGFYHIEGFLRTHDPDLIFLEYGSNDAAHELVYEETQMHYQGMIEKIHAYDPTIQIIFSSSLRKDTSAQVLSGGGSNIGFRQATYELAAHYDIPVLDWGIYLARHIRDSEHTWNRLTDQADGVHPNEEGYAINAEHMYPILKAMIDAAEPSLQAVSLPETTFLPYSLLYSTTASFSLGSYDSSFTKSGMAVSHTVGAKMAFDFTGTGIGVYWNINHDGADVAYRIRNTEGEIIKEGKVSATNSLCLRKNSSGAWVYTNGRDTHRYFAYGLEYGDYTLELEILDSNLTVGQYTADGHAIRIRQFLILDGDE